MTKADSALRTIGEVAADLGIRQHVLRYWEEQFPMLRPLTRAGGRRYYRPDDVELVRTIHRLLDQEGFTIRGARQALQGGSVPVADEPTVADAAAITTPDPALIQRLQALRQRLATVLAADAAHA